MVPGDVLEAYGLRGGTVRQLQGLINQSFLVDAAGRRAVVQRLHPVFGAEVHFDIEAVTARLAAQGLSTPRLLRTVGGRLWLERDGGVWRAQSFIEGVTHQRIRDRAQARAAGAAVARFHRALDGFEHAFHFTRVNVHDTAAHLGALGAALRSASDEERDDACELGARILQAAEQLDLSALAALPLRICHGDLKISNLRFMRGEPPRVAALIDLDTVGHQRMAYELGDALRSWCNPHSEDSEQPRLDPQLFEAALAGYAEQARGLLHPAEVDALVPGLHTVCIELAARFCHDAFADSYFGWDPGRYPTRRAHNLARARAQLALARSVGQQLDALRQRSRALFAAR